MHSTQYEKDVALKRAVGVKRRYRCNLTLYSIYKKWPETQEFFFERIELYFQYYDLAADVLAENAHLTYKYLSSVSRSYMI
jgi:hypothetical protein